MWRTLLLGKLGLSIAASVLVGGICVSQPWRVEYSFVQAASWIGAGSFFLLLAVAQIATVFILLRKKKFAPPAE